MNPEIVINLIVFVAVLQFIVIIALLFIVGSGKP